MQALEKHIQKKYRIFILKKESKMKGKVLGFDLQKNTGVISGDDNHRYDFNISEWQSEKSPMPNQIVDFVISENNATAIYLDAKSIVSDGKSKIAAALLAFFLGGLGIHKFYLGCNTAGIIMLVLFLGGFILFGIPSFIIAIISFIEFILYIIKSDADFQNIYVENRRCWF